MFNEFLRKHGRVLGLISIALVLNACQGPHWFWLSLSSRAQAPSGLEAPLKVATVYGTLTAKKQYGWSTGYEHDVLEKFASEHGQKLKLIFFKSKAKAQEALVKGQADVLSVGSGEFTFGVNSQSIQKKYNRWFIHASRSGSLNEIRARYFSYADELTEIDLHYLNRHIQERLPRFLPQFRHFAREFQIPWTWLAAVAYQESKWDDQAVSFTGVRGLMQVTWETADILGIEDRHDTTQSILAGAKYLRQLMNRMPKQLAAREKFIFALISYNVGVAHLIDAQKLAEEFNLNPWAWSSLEKTLPLLAQEQYYSRLKYGYARGEEPVQFVRHVLSYLDRLENTNANALKYRRE